MNGIKAAAIKTAKQMAREPFEVLRAAPSHTLGAEIKNQKLQNAKTQNNEKTQSEKTNAAEQKDKDKTQRFTLALNAELKDIQRQKLFEEILKKISEGEDVNLEQYSDLTIEQKQVLKAHMEVTRTRREQSGERKSFVEPTTKPKRNLFAGAKTQLERMKRKSEIRMPPSG